MKTLSVAVVMATLLALPVSAATIVQNGSFEDDFAGAGINNHNTHASMPGASGNASWDIFTNVPGWAVTSGDGLELQTRLTIPLTPYDGDYYAELDGNKNTTINQTVTLGIGKYTLTFYYSPRVNKTPDTTNQVDYGISGLVFGIVSGPEADHPFGVWTKVTQTFDVALAGNYDLFFDAAGQSDSLGGFVDAIAITPAAVPIPAAGLMLFGALGGLTALRRKRAA